MRLARVPVVALCAGLLACACSDSDATGSDASSTISAPAARPATPAPPTSSGGQGGGAASSTAVTGGTAATTAPDTSPPSTAAARPDPTAARVALTHLAELDQPVDVVTGPGGALYIAEKSGRAVRLDPDDADADTYLDLSQRVSTGGEQGLLGLAFAGERFYASYTDTDGTSVLASWRLDGEGMPDPDSEQIVLTVEQPFANHNGGDLAVGPDGLLYWGLGDGGSGGDPMGHGQDPSTLLGSILRIRPTPDGPEPYEVPADNPFADGVGGRPEVWVFGLRNPWRFSFDAATGDLWIGDVGQSSREEIDHLPAGAQAGANLGWNIMEGTEPFEGDAPPPGHVPPVFEYGRDQGLSVTGGVVYRGSAIPQLHGAYLYSDYGGGWLDALVLDRSDPAAASVSHTRLLEGVGPVTAFGDTAGGEIVLVTLDGRVLALVPA